MLLEPTQIGCRRLPLSGRLSPIGTMSRKNQLELIIWGWLTDFLAHRLSVLTITDSHPIETNTTHNNASRYRRRLSAVGQGSEGGIGRFHARSPSAL